MQALETRRGTVRVARLLDEASACSRAAKTDPGRCRRGWYRRKDTMLEAALAAGQGQFYLASCLAGPPALIGISHLLTARRFHLRLDSMSVNLRRLVSRMAVGTGVELPEKVRAELYGTARASGGGDPNPDWR